MHHPPQNAHESLAVDDQHGRFAASNAGPISGEAHMEFIDATTPPS